MQINSAKKLQLFQFENYNELLNKKAIIQLKSNFYYPLVLLSNELIVHL